MSVLVSISLLESRWTCSIIYLPALSICMVSRFILTFLLLVSCLMLVPRVYANTTDFPSCETLLSQPGDRAHFTSGTHQIAGGSLVSGSDDVYSLADNNFLQCFCPSDGGRGIQTNWLRSDSGIDGTQWNLGNFNYAVQNTGFNCHPAGVLSSAPQPCNGCGGSSVPVCDSLKPQAPTNFSVIRTGATAKLSWNESASTTHYSIVYGTKPGQYEFGVVNTGKTNTFTVGSLDPGQKYYFAVSSVNNCMPSDLTTSGEVLGASTVKGLAGTGSGSQIANLFIIGFVSLILFAGVSKLISLCENSENTQKLARAAASYLRNQLRIGSMVYVEQILQSCATQLFFGSPGRAQSCYRYRSGALAYSLSGI